MSDARSDALVFFGATGDLAYKKIFPALQAMIKRGTLDVPVIGVAKAGWNLEEAWRIVDPVLKADTPVFEYEPGTWGPDEVDRITPAAGWHNPTVAS